MLSLYPIALLLEENAKLRVVSREFPEILTWGEDEAEALALAADALDVVVSYRLDHGEEVPEPSAARPGEHLVPLPAQLAAKLAVIHAWRASGLTKSDLARRMGLNEGEVRRILDPRHGTKLDRLDAAARALGRRLLVGSEAA